MAADIPGIRDVVGDGGAALIPPGNAPRLADAVAALGDPEQHARIGAAGRALVAAEHTWAQRAGRILATAAGLAPAGAAR